MPASAYRSRYIIAVLFAIILLATSCKKTQDKITENILQQYFETNILNRDFKVKLATDTARDLTTQYEGQTFRLLKNTNYDGPMVAKKNGVEYNGNWSCNEDFSKLTININQGSIPVEFNFLNRAWRFTKKAVPVMELAPWGSTDPKVLHMERL
ncbi:MAG: hypothetical protein JST02_03345 [Bacteroidetes bacterium]|nr:hypothetical protein [Bacteroidota bacterium]